MAEVVNGEVYNPPKNGQALIEEEEMLVGVVVDDVSDEWQIVAESNSKTEETPKKSYASIAIIHQSIFYPLDLLIHYVYGFIGSYSSRNFSVLDVGKSDIFYFNLLLQVKVVRGPFSVAQPHAIHWISDLTRLGFCLGSCFRNSTLGQVVQWLSVYF